MDESKNIFVLLDLIIHWSSLNFLDAIRILTTTTSNVDGNILRELCSRHQANINEVSHEVNLLINYLTTEVIDEWIDKQQWMMSRWRMKTTNDKLFHLKIRLLRLFLFQFGFVFIDCTSILIF